MRKKQTELPDPTLFQTAEIAITLTKLSDQNNYTLGLTARGMACYITANATELVKLGDRLLNAVGEST